MTYRILICLLFTLACSAATAQQPPVVVVSIKPLHAIVASVMEGVAAPKLLISGHASPHHFSARPSQRAALLKADMVVMIDPAFETFMPALLKDAPERQKLLAVSAAPGIRLLPRRTGEAWGTHSHDHDDTPFAQQAPDYHLWLNPANGAAIALYVAEVLSQQFPDDGDRFTANAAAYLARLTTLDVALNAQLAKVKARPFALHHEATRYFEDHYGLHATGALTAEPHTPLSAGGLAKRLKRWKKEGTTCLLGEPGAATKKLETVLQEAGMNAAAIDPEATQMRASPALYEDLLRDMAQATFSCLSHGVEVKTITP